MSSVICVAALVRQPGLRDNGFLIVQSRSVEALPFMTSLEKEHLARLIRRSKAGDEQAMEQIYTQYKDSLFNLAYRYTSNRQAAEDLLQDIFIKVFTRIGDVQKEETFAAWVYRIALNACYSYLRSRRSRESRTVSLSEVEGKKGEAAYESGEKSLERPLNDAIDELPAKLKAVFLLHDVQGFKHGEIAGMLRIRVGTSKSHLFKARTKIRKYLKTREIL
jgi:RNA polymerase sigma-70 factor (ECF subfamily)